MVREKEYLSAMATKGVVVRQAQFSVNDDAAVVIVVVVVVVVVVFVVVVEIGRAHV